MVDRRAANAVDIRHRRILADLDAAIDARTKVFGEMRMQLGADDADFLIGMDDGLAVARALTKNSAREQ
jgi:hypothetical protein